MDDFIFTSTNSEPDPKDKEVMVAGMLAYHAKNGHPRKVDHFSVTVRDRNNTTVGVAMVSFLWNGMEIDSLWVNEAYRGQGIGRQLMGLVEEEGVKRGCTVAYTNTFSYQAPKFYERLGYKLIGTIDNFPVGSFLNYYQKQLKPK